MTVCPRRLHLDAKLTVAHILFIIAFSAFRLPFLGLPGEGFRPAALLLLLEFASLGWFLLGPRNLPLRLLAHVLYYSLSYMLLAEFVPSLGMPDGAKLLGACDRWLFGCEPARELHTLFPSWVHEVFAVGYALFLPYLYLNVGRSIATDRARTARRFVAGLAALYAVGYLGYVLLPAAGPRFHDEEVAGGAAFVGLTDGPPLSRALSAFMDDHSGHRNVFPSLHAAVSLWLWVFELRYRSRLWALMLSPVVAGIWIGTVYQGYHYGVDLLAALLLVALAQLAARRAAPRGGEFPPPRLPGGAGALALALAIVVSGCTGTHPPPAPFPQDVARDRTGPIVLVGDLQRTSGAERLLGREQNDPERRRIVEALCRESPALIVVLGDLVFDGASAREWRDLDALLEPVRGLGAPVLPALGNHDYWGADRKALGNLQARFPQLRASRWYARRVGRLGLLWLDSNRSDLGEAPWREQLAWYAATLEALDADASLRGVLVFSHHPPYSNSTVTGDEAHVIQDLVPPFARARKTLAMFSGHVHAYEHFEAGGKHFFVSGGGGGPRVELLDGPGRRHPDRYEGPSPRPFHYLVLREDDGGVRVWAKGFRKGETTALPIDAVRIPWRA